MTFDFAVKRQAKLLKLQSQNGIHLSSIGATSVVIEKENGDADVKAPEQLEFCRVLSGKRLFGCNCNNSHISGFN